VSECGVLVEKLQTVDAFVVFDLQDAPTSVGVLRSAPKILIDGATWLARSQTYQFASFEHRLGGASGGVNAPASEKADAVASFVAEVEPWVTARRLVIDAAKGVEPEHLEALRNVDPRPLEYWEQADQYAAAGIVAAAAAALGGLDGRTVAVEGFNDLGPSLATEVADRDGRIVAVSTTAGTARRADGFEPPVLREAWTARAADLVHELQSEAEPPGNVFGASVDVLVCGSRAGIVDHGVAAECSAKVIVPGGSLPVTAKGLAVLRRSGVCVLPDFVTTAGSTLGGVAPALSAMPAPSIDDVRESVVAVVTEVLDHHEGPLLGACHRAEAFLRTWRSELPFGRPLA
jgi:glutamate dehydrogenase/leucine dehydrogenase